MGWGWLGGGGVGGACWSPWMQACLVQTTDPVGAAVLEEAVDVQGAAVEVVQHLGVNGALQTGQLVVRGADEYPLPLVQLHVVEEHIVFASTQPGHSSMTRVKAGFKSDASLVFQGQPPMVCVK